MLECKIWVQKTCQGRNLWNHCRSIYHSMTEKNVGLCLHIVYGFFELGKKKKSYWDHNIRNSFVCPNCILWIFLHSFLSCVVCKSSSKLKYTKSCSILKYLTPNLFSSHVMLIILFTFFLLVSPFSSCVFFSYFLQTTSNHWKRGGTEIKTKWEYWQFSLGWKNFKVLVNTCLPTNKRIKFRSRDTTTYLILYTLHCGPTQGCDVVGHSLCILAQDTQLELDTFPFLQAIPFVGHPNYAKWIDLTFHIPCKEK